MLNVVQLCLVANNILSMRLKRKPRFSPSCGRSCVKMADRFADLSKSDLRSNDKTITELGYRKIQ